MEVAMRDNGNKARVAAVQNLRRGGAAGTHADRRTKRARQRRQAVRAELRVNGWGN
jgi:hypothetical protein